MSSVKSLFLEYAGSLGFDLSFQDFNRELAELPGEYSEPAGCILIAREGSAIVGCVALRSFGGREVCEMKRLYVRVAFRGRGVGRQLAESIIAEAKVRGYRKMKLDTLASMGKAIQLYKSLGFKQIAPYRHNPIEGAVFMQLELESFKANH
jgi:ribosomal protein S18 acetylase RimI-like enzyme